MAAGETALRQTLRGVLERWDAADRRVWEYRAREQPADREAAEAERRDIEGELHALAAELADLLLLLLRQAVRHNPGELRQQLMELLAPDIGALVKGALKERHGR
jgi:type IV pilus biogenesis protein CpaD/CtpE